MIIPFAVLLAIIAHGALALERPTRKNVWDIEIGSNVADLSDREFQEYACGTDGGPPSTPIDGWSNYAKCGPDQNGLHEVYFRYDDEVEYWAKANRIPSVVRMFNGTQVLGYHAIVSALIEPGGRIVGVRIVTDPRLGQIERARAWTLRNFLQARFQREGWDCVDLPRDERELPVGSRFIKQVCEKTQDDVRLVLRTHLRRKPGQLEFETKNKKRTEGQFESFTRLDLIHVSIPPNGI
jgi:hypothetical protein